MKDSIARSALEIREELSDGEEGIHSALYTRESQVLHHGVLEVNVRTNSRTVYLSLSYTGNMGAGMEKVDRSAKRLLGLTTEDIEKLARESEQSGSPDYMWSMSAEVPTDTILDIVNRNSIIE